MSDIIEVIKDVTTVTIASDGPQGPTGPTGATGAAGATGATGSSGVISVVAPITNTGTSTSAVIGINSGVANGVATLDSNGKVPQSQIPAVAITNTFVVASQAAMLALTAEEGDVAVRTDQNKTYILTATPASTLANWQELLTPTDAVQSVDGRTGTVTLTDKYAQLATANTFTGGVQQITTASAATVGLIIKGVSGQTSSLQEWQDNTGAVVSRVSPNGNFNIGSTLAPKTVLQVTQSASAPSVPVLGTASGGLYIANLGGAYGLLFGLLGTGNAWIQNQRTDAVATAYSITFQPSGGNIGIGPVSGTPSAKLQVHSDAAATVVAIVRGAASQTANLFEAQNSAGSALSRIDSAGNMYANGFITSRYITDINSTTPYIDFTGNKLTINSRNAAYVGLVVQGVASQTANLFEIQDSSSNILAQISSAGAVTLRANDGANNHRTTITTNTSGIVFNSTRSAGAACNFIIQTANVERFIVTENGTAQFTNVAAAAVAVVIQGAASQTADLQQWRSSTPTTLTTITSAGTINFASGNTSATANTGAVALPALAVGFITMQVAGTTVKVPYYAN
jgi:hypothetical protein